MTLPYIPCKPLREYKGPKPRSWRTYTGYTRVAPFTNSCPSSINERERNNRYVRWLMETRGWDQTTARAYAFDMNGGQECRLLSANLAGEDMAGKASKPKAPNWRAIVAAARKALEAGSPESALTILQAAA